MLNSSQRAQLRSLANGIDTIVQVGKGGITENVEKQVDSALTARELIKGRVLEASMLSAREAAEALSTTCGAETVQVIGSRFVLYRENKKLSAEKRIKLVR